MVGRVCVDKWSLDAVSRAATVLKVPSYKQRVAFSDEQRRLNFTRYLVDVILRIYIDSSMLYIACTMSRVPPDRSEVRKLY